MTLRPRTLFAQILLALLLGVAVALALSFWLLLDDRDRFLSRQAEFRVAEHIAAAITTFDVADAAGRTRLVRGLDRRPMHLSLDQPWQSLPQPAGDDARRFSRLVARQLDRPVELQVVSIVEGVFDQHHGGAEGGPPFNGGPGGPGGPQFRGPPGGPPASPNPGPDPGPGPAPPGVPAGAPSGPSAAIGDQPPGWRRPLAPSFGEPAAIDHPHNRVILECVVQVRLADGAVLTIHDAAGRPLEDQPWRLIGWLSLVVGTMAILATWLARRVTRPLHQLADAAGRLGRNLALSPVPESGPAETRGAAHAFNRMQQELQRTVEARAQALAGLSHDLRLPLTRMRLRIETLGDTPARAGIEADLGEMDEMIGHTLEYLRAGPTAEPFAQIDLDALLDSLIDEADEVGTAVDRQGSAGAPLQGQARALRRCFANLIDNARRYGAGPIDIAVLDRGNRVEIAVQDRGPGIPAADRERVLEPYVRLEPSRARHTGGSGLGLAIARAVARGHDGDVTLAERPGGGLSVVVTLARGASRPTGAGSGAGHAAAALATPAAGPTGQERHADANDPAHSGAMVA